MSGGMAGTPQANSNSIGPIVDDPSALLTATEALGARIVQVRTAISRVIFGQDEVIDLMLTSLLAGGRLESGSRESGEASASDDIGR